MQSPTVIDGLVRLITPLHVASFDRSSFSTPGSAGAANHTPTATMPVWLHGDDRPFHLPMYSGNSIRGRTRRVAGRMIASRIKPLSIQQYHFLTCGSVSASPASGGTADLAMLAAARRDLYLGVWGGGPYLAPSAFRARPMLPICGSTLTTGMVPDEFAQFAVPAKSNWDLLTRFTCLKKDDLLMGADTGVRELFVDYDAVALEYAAGVYSASVARKASKEAEANDRTARKAAKAAGIVVAPSEKIAAAKKTTLANIFSLDAIPAGVPMYFRIEAASHLSAAQLTLLSRCVLAMFNDPLGGWGRAGFGVAAPELRITRCGETRPLGQLEEGRWQLHPDSFNDAELQSLETELAAVTIDSVNSLIVGQHA